MIRTELIENYFTAANTPGVTPRELTVMNLELKRHLEGLDENGFYDEHDVKYYAEKVEKGL